MKDSLNRFSALKQFLLDISQKFNQDSGGEEILINFVFILQQIVDEQFRDSNYREKVLDFLVEFIRSLDILH